ncbi:Mor transcription activator family protein [Intestinibacter bartlettii]|uniref:DNA-binding protein n=1 Tax=Intestinibacter bartlettii TaxID=261299 RepID=A0ABS6E1C9_9FIRM|nr:Mor transcription activator family protein [Intestinibacter bartlettii]MBU5337261.1 DNA-binding protein [Intestinibacter bartlettii]
MSRKKDKVQIPEYLKRLIEIVGEESYRKIVEHYGGTSIYIPVDVDYTRIERNKMIYEEFKRGMTYRELTRKYGLSESSIRKIIKMMRKEK